MTTQDALFSPTAPARRELWFDADGARLFAVETGQGHPVVFLHGGLADHRAALYRAGRLAATQRLITPDLRGAGRSVYAGDLSWDLLADDLVALLDHLGLERAVIGGTSMGSAVALRFALRHPRRTRGAILMSPLYPGADRPLADAPTAAMVAMGQAGERALQHGTDALRPLFEQLPAQLRAVALEMLRGFDAPSVAATTRFLARLEEPMRSARELAALEVPVAVLPGTDPQHPAEVATLYLEHLRHPTLIDPTADDAPDQLARFCRAASERA